MISEHEQSVVNWLADLESKLGYEGMVHELTAYLDEGRNARSSARRFHTLLAETAEIVGKLYEETGETRLLDCEADLRRLIQWADSGSQPIQLDLFEMPSEQ